MNIVVIPKNLPFTDSPFFLHAVFMHLCDITAELNAHLDSPVLTKTVSRELHRVIIYGQAASETFSRSCQCQMSISVVPGEEILG